MWQKKHVASRLVLCGLGLAVIVNFLKTLDYEEHKALIIPFLQVPIGGAKTCPQEYDSHWLGIMRNTQCKGLEFVNRQTMMKSPDE